MPYMRDSAGRKFVVSRSLEARRPDFEVVKGNLYPGQRTYKQIKDQPAPSGAKSESVAKSESAAKSKSTAEAKSTTKSASKGADDPLKNWEE